MAIAEALVTRNPNDLDASAWMPVDEVLRRVIERFPLADVDRERGNRLVREAVDKLIEVSAHNVVLDEWRSMEGRVAYVTIRERVGWPAFGFFLKPQTTIFEIDYERPEDRDACQPLIVALAEALEYDILTEDDVDEDLDDEDMTDDDLDE